MKKLVFNNRESLKTAESQTLGRKLGIIVSEPYYNAGAEAVVCELETEYVSVNTTSSISWPKIGELNEQAVIAHDRMIENLDRVIDELTEHKQRFTEGRQLLVSGMRDLDKLAAQLYEPPKS